MISQYNEIGTIPSQIQQVFAAKISLLDHYVMMRTGEYEYSMILKKPSGEVIVYQASRVTSGYSNTYEITSYNVDDYRYSYTNEYTLISNEGIGTQIDLPVYDYVGAVSQAVFTVLISFVILYKGLLFTIFRKKRY